ncbi:dynein heavy chain axonemal [Limosa lapponica baueri]|uniref:Dynein heavy chain axonemal n=1 Tax=Limosa lapponica baueri TaxID=1758121 RepID=A0A2I0T291_LIMLA|nr:dynein heavy chain axonemal [Limosa lapponica baueri]
MDRRLATILCQGFDDCNCLASAVKVRVSLQLDGSCPWAWGILGAPSPAPGGDGGGEGSLGHPDDALEHRSRHLFAPQLVHMFSSLLERPLIKAEVSRYYSALLGMFKAELEDVKVLYDAQTASPPPPGVEPAINKNMPPVAGQLKWALELQQRLEGPQKDLFAISHPYVWVIPSPCGDTGQQPGQDPAPHGSFYALRLQQLLYHLPDSVMESAEAKLVLGKYEEMMGLLQSYRQKVYEEWAQGAGRDCHFSLEQPLILRDPTSSVLSVNFSKEVGAGAGDTTDHPPERVMEYIQEMRDILYDLQARVQKAKLNMEKINQLMEECSATPLFERKDNKETALLDLDGKASTLTKRYAAIRDTGVKIHEMVKENENLFKADKSSQIWLDYVGHLDEIVLDGFFNLIHKSLQLLLNNMAPDVGPGQEYSAGFEEQAHLWLQSPEEFLQHFLTLGSVPSPEELELQPEVSVAHGTPSLQLFKQEIDTCEELCEEVSGFSNTEVFGGWLQSDCRPFKQALLSTVRSRGMVLRQHLANHVTTSLQELQDFIREANAGLNKPLEEGDYDGLVEVMGHLMRVKERQVETDGLFQPLRETVALLSTYGEEMSEEIHLQLQPTR